MKIQFWSIGKTNEAYVKHGVEEFTKRIITNFTNKHCLSPKFHKPTSRISGSTAKFLQKTLSLR